MNARTLPALTAALLTALFPAMAGAEAKPLKVFILAGQSNMEAPQRWPCSEKASAARREHAK